MTFGERLRQLRQRQGRTQTQLAELLGMSQSGVSKLESLREEPRNYHRLAGRLSEALNVTEAELFVELMLPGPHADDDSSEQIARTKSHAREEPLSALQEHPKLRHILGEGWKYLDATQKLLLVNTASQLYEMAQYMYDAPPIPRDNPRVR